MVDGYAGSSGRGTRACLTSARIASSASISAAAQLWVKGDEVGDENEVDKEIVTGTPRGGGEEKQRSSRRRRRSSRKLDRGQPKTRGR